MNQSRPFLTVICFALFAAVFYSSNVQPESLYCPDGAMAQPATLQRMVAEIRHAVHEATRPPREP